MKVSEPHVRKQRRSAISRVLLSLTAIGIAGVLVAGAASFYAYEKYALPGPLSAKKMVVIERGLGAPEIGAKLEDAGIISDSRVFSAMALATGMRGRLKPGEYEFAPETTMRDVMAAIAAGKAITYKLNIPEGWTSDMVLARLQENEILTGNITAPAAEGGILPDTYLFRRGQTRQELLAEMQEAHDKLIKELWQARSPLVALKTPEEAVILASIVEKETAKPEERPIVASVFLNRLKKGMRLQSDPTIIYGIVGGKGKLDRQLTRSDIDTTTPYNTYRIDGLPPGPIANPGRAALEAVLNPPITEYIYFVADGSGGHAFAVTLDEHNRNVERWRQITAAAAAASAEAESVSAAQDETAMGATQPGKVTTPLPDIAEPAATAIPEPITNGQKTQETTTGQTTGSTGTAGGTAKPAAKASGEGADAETASTEPEQQPQELKPGSLIEVNGTLVAIPRPKPKRKS